MTRTQNLLNELAKAKALFQTRAILAAMGVNPDSPNAQASAASANAASSDVSVLN